LNFTAKEDYGIRAVVDIAINRTNVPVQAKEISARHNIPEQFLEQVLAILRRGGIIKSIRGASGGYDLVKSPKETSVGDVIKVLSGPFVPIQCVNDDQGICPAQESCSASHFWSKLKDAIETVLGGTTVQDLVDHQFQNNKIQSYMMYI
jgi:Rrf2 family protein